MSPLLQVVLALAVVALTAALIPLLLQLRRTAAALETSAREAARDLNRVATDLHEARTRLEGLADLAQSQLEHPGFLSQVAFGVARALPLLLNPEKGRGNFLEILLSGVDRVVALFRQHSTHPPQPTPEAPHE